MERQASATAAWLPRALIVSAFAPTSAARSTSLSPRRSRCYHRRGERFWGRGRFSERSASPPDPLSRRAAGVRGGTFLPAWFRLSVVRVSDEPGLWSRRLTEPPRPCGAGGAVAMFGSRNDSRSCQVWAWQLLSHSLRQYRTNELVRRRMNFSSDAMADFEGLLEVNRKICEQQMAEKGIAYAANELCGIAFIHFHHAGILGSSPPAASFRKVGRWLPRAAGKVSPSTVKRHLLARRGTGWR